MKLLQSLLLMLSVCIPLQAMAQEPATFRTWVDEKGVISLPKDYRSHWAHLGSWLVADASAPGHGFHDVYAQPEAVAYFQKTGQFPDGAVIVKEVREVRDGIKTTGQAQWAGDISIWFVMVKDSKGRFENSSHWSSGWGWALFESKAPDRNVSKGFGSSCEACHTPAKAQDWVFTEGYPVLNTLPQVQ